MHTAEQKKPKRNKPSSDYLRIDLKPNGEDLKTYVIKQAELESKYRGTPISATNYIQNLIRQDRDKDKFDQRYTITEQLKKVPEQYLSALEAVIKGLSRR